MSEHAGPSKQAHIYISDRGVTHKTHLCTAQRVDATSQDLGAGHRVTAVGSLLGGHSVCVYVYVYVYLCVGES